MNALYHQENRPPAKFAVLKTHDDKTVDLGPEKGEAVITRCPVSPDGKPGTCRLVTPEEEAAEDKKAKASEAATKKAEDKAEEAAEKAAKHK